MPDLREKCAAFRAMRVSDNRAVRGGGKHGGVKKEREEVPVNPALQLYALGRI